MFEGVGMRAGLGWLMVMVACVSPQKTADSSDSGESTAGMDPRFDPENWPGTVGGPDRPAHVYAPTDWDGTSRMPVVVMLHGYGATGIVQDVYMQLRPRLEVLGAIYVLPDGLKDSFGAQYWNANPYCCDFDGSGVDDVGYLMGLIDELEASVLRHLPVHLVVLLDLRARLEVVTDWRIHRHQDDLGIRPRGENPLDHVLEISTGLDHRCLVVEIGIVDPELYEERIGLLLYDASFQVLDTPGRPHSTGATVYDCGLAGPTCFECSVELSHPCSARGQARAVGDYGLGFAGFEILDQLTLAVRLHLLRSRELSLDRIRAPGRGR